MKKILLLHFSLFFLIANCQKKKQVMNIIPTNNSENIEIKKDTMPDLDIKSMKEMLDEEYDYIDSDTPSTAKTILWMDSEIYKALIKNGYKVPTKSNFESKIKTIFNINVNQPSSCSKVEINQNYVLIYGKRGLEIEKEKISRSKFYPYNATENIFLMRKEHFINFVLSPIALVIFSIDSTSYKVKIPQEIISRNKYLFNDDKSQFSWLINNDEDFMQSLVTTFGYTEDKKLLKWAFEKQGFKYQKYPPDEILKNYGNFLWTKQCNGEIKLHPNTLNLIKELVTPSSKYGKEEYILYLAEYINYLVNNEKETELNFQQKAKIAAYLLAFGEQYKYNKEYGYNQMFLGKFIFYQDPDKKYKKEFEKNNYYNLPNLKKWYQQAEQEKDMFENDQTLADDPQPMDYLYRATYMKGPYSK